MTPSPSRAAQAWSFLTAVPGRPAASRAAQLRRAAPLLLPALVFGALLGWKWGIEAPRLRAERALNQPLVNLEREVAALQWRRPPGQTPGAIQAAALRAALPSTPAGLASLLGSWRAEADARGWEAVFGPPMVPSAGPDLPVVFVSVRAGLQPAAGNPHPWSSLVGLLGAFSDPESRIEVTRLAIRADEQGRYAVETRLSTPYLAETQENAK
jgi:hypothetical protein